MYNGIKNIIIILVSLVILSGVLYGTVNKKSIIYENSYEYDLYLVRVSEPLSVEQKKYLNEFGIENISYAGDLKYYFYGKDISYDFVTSYLQQNEKLKIDITDYHKLSYEDKICKPLWIEINSKNIDEDKIVKINVAFLIKLTYEQIIYIINENQIEAEVLESNSNLKNAKISLLYEEIIKLAKLAQVQFIEKGDIELKDCAVEFVKNIYSNILDREETAISQIDIDFWSSKIKSDSSIVPVVEFFIESDEFKSLDLSDKGFIEKLYLIFFGREADQDGADYWLSKLNDGISEKLLMHKFAFSDEFQKISMLSDLQAYTKEDQLSSFIERLYVYVLKRDSDFSGIRYWIEEFNLSNKSAYDIVMDFFGSPEFAELELKDEAFIDTIYKTIMGREADTNGIKYWVLQLENGEVSREEVLKSFLYSGEFENIAKEFGIDVF